MNHEQEALEAAVNGRYEVATFHAQMFAAQQLRLGNLIALANDNDMIDPTRGTWQTGFFEDARQRIVTGLGL